MGISYEDAVLAQEELEVKILADPNVVSIGVIAETNELGEPTGDYAVQVGVISIETYVRAQKCGQSSIPTEFLLRSEGDSTEEKHIHINIIREGKIEALMMTSESAKDDIPSAKDDLLANIKSVASYTRNQIRTTSMSKPGDSGSCLVEKGTKKPVGLLFAGSDVASYYSPMRVVLSALSMPHTYQYPSGASCCFSSDHPLRILQKRLYSTFSAPTFYRESVTRAQSIRSLPMRYKVAATLASVGFCAVSTKLANLTTLERKADGPLSRKLTSCCFFRTASMQPSVGTVHKPDVEFRR